MLVVHRRPGAPNCGAQDQVCGTLRGVGISLYGRSIPGLSDFGVPEQRRWSAIGWRFESMLKQWTRGGHLLRWKVIQQNSMNGLLCRTRVDIRAVASSARRSRTIRAVAYIWMDAPIAVAETDLATIAVRRPNRPPTQYISSARTLSVPRCLSPPCSMSASHHANLNLSHGFLHRERPQNVEIARTPSSCRSYLDHLNPRWHCATIRGQARLRRVTDNLDDLLLALAEI